MFKSYRRVPKTKKKTGTENCLWKGNTPMLNHGWIPKFYFSGETVLDYTLSFTPAEQHTEADIKIVKNWKQKRFKASARLFILNKVNTNFTKLLLKSFKFFIYFWLL